MPVAPVAQDTTVPWKINRLGETSHFSQGVICCGNSCTTSGSCGLVCTGTGTGAACPASCSQGEACADCCEGFCAAYGACTTIYYSQQGGACSLADPTACAPGLTCCLSRHCHGEGVCQDSC